MQSVKISKKYPSKFTKTIVKPRYRELYLCRPLWTYDCKVSCDVEIGGVKSKTKAKRFKKSKQTHKVKENN